MAISTPTPLTIFRNREWIQAFTMLNPDGTAMTITGDQWALFILSSDQTVLVSNTSPVIVSNVVTFTMLDTITAALLPDATGTLKQWQYIRKPNGASGTDLIAYGPLTVLNSPPSPF